MVLVGRGEEWTGGAVALGERGSGRRREEGGISVARSGGQSFLGDTVTISWSRSCQGAGDLVKFCWGSSVCELSVR